MGVKRFDYILGTGPEEGWMEEAALGQYVRSIEYDSLAGELVQAKLDAINAWAAFYKLRKSVGESRYPGMTAEIKSIASESEKIMVEKAVGGHAVCHTCEAHCVAIEDLEQERDALAADLAEAKATIECKDDTWCTDLDAAVAALTARIATLEAALREVCDELDYYGDQAGEYFRKKGGCDETLAKARALLIPVVETPPSEQEKYV